MTYNFCMTFLYIDISLFYMYCIFYEPYLIQLTHTLIIITYKPDTIIDLTHFHGMFCG